MKYMQIKTDIANDINSILKKDNSYKAESYIFLLNSLDYTLETFKKRHNRLVSQRHITGQEMSYGIKDFAIKLFGPTAKLVLNSWGIYKTIDFGKIVYNLIEVGLMGKNSKDKLSDFENVFNFENVFIKNYVFSTDIKKTNHKNVHFEKTEKKRLISKS